jgi:proteasome activator subunit 4
MSMRGLYHKERVAQLVENFKKWWSERSPGVRAFQSTYDRCDLLNLHAILDLY